MKVQCKSFLRQIKKGVHLGVAKALAEHKKAGRSIVVWKNGKMIEIPPEKIGIQEDEPLREVTNRVSVSKKRQ